ncbi:MAG: tetratricopeptide repeat protein [Deltaproteobacteria bacterium]|nr:tetratricopeptide repeat protein [Deltaproteobacteria bacterium]
MVSKKNKSEADGLEQSFAAAMRAAETSPESTEAWDHLEDLADSLQRPEEVAELYRKVLSPKLSVDIRRQLSERSINFHEEWFGDNPQAMNSVLSRVIEIDPEATWAFERLTVVLTAAEQWDELLAAYDRALESTRDDEAHLKQLLDDAAHIAKDFANDPNRAVDYLQRCIALDPSNTQLASSTERLLERLERWTDLVDLWRMRIAVVSRKKAHTIRMQIVDCCLEHLSDPTQALTELSNHLDDKPGDPDGCRKLEQVLTFKDAPVEVRIKSLDLLRTNYDIAKDSEAVVAAIQTTLAFAPSSEKLALHREAGMRLAVLGKDAEAIEHYGKLLLEDPSAPDARKQIRLLAARSNQWALHAGALVMASEASSEASLKVALLVEAANVYWESLGDTSTAIDLFSRILATEEIDQSIALTTAHNLNELLAAADRSEERLKVLERLADLERAGAVRRIILGEAAELAEELGDPDKALAFWQGRLKNNVHDTEAIGAVASLLERNERWDELVNALRQRTEAPILPEQFRADLVRIAEIQATRLNKVDDAIDTWLEILAGFGPNPDILMALDGLMTLTTRWNELATLLEGAADNQYAHAVALLSRVGDICRIELNQLEKAANYYKQTLLLAPGNKPARAGLKALIDPENAQPDVVEALAGAYRATDDWKLVLDFLETRLEAAEDDTKRAALLVEAAGLHANRAQDQGAALGSLARAFPLSPSDETIERDLLQLAEAMTSWADAAKACREAAGSATGLPARQIDLRLTEGRLYEEKLDDLTRAAEAYAAVIEQDPKSEQALHAAVRVAARSGLWKSAAASAIVSATSRDRLEAGVLELLESTAEESSAWNELTEALASALAESDTTRHELARDFEIRIALWHRDRRDDLEAAEAAARRAADHKTGHLETLLLLASLQRQKPGPALIETLLAIDELTDRDLDSLREAVQVALDTSPDYENKRSVALRLYQKASRLWQQSELATGEHTAQSSASWIVENIVSLDLAADRPDKATQLLLDAVKLPFADEAANAMRLRAANILAGQNQRVRAISLYSQVMRKEEENLELLHRLQSLLEQENRIPELLVLLRQELDMTEEPERRLGLRLEISRLVGDLEGRDERVQSLCANLEEEPGHSASIDAVCEILNERARYSTLADLLTEQAKKLEEISKPQETARLWGLVADLAEKQLEDDERAVFAYTRVVEIDCTSDALDALARLCRKRGAPAEAATWLRRRLLDTEDPLSRISVMLRLARAQIQSSQQDRAVTTLETAFNEAPRNGEVRKLLMSQYRSREAWEPLAGALSTSTEHISDETTILAYAQEAAEIYQRKLHAPELSVPVLERALPFSPDDRKLRSMLAEGLLAAERLDEAREMVLGLLKDFGRRRSSERAAAHLLLARIVHEQGDNDEALDQLEQASKMDNQNIAIWQTLAELARETGQLEKAERAYRTLLLIVRRGPQTGDADQIGTSEVLMELSQIAEDQGQSDQAAELCESAFEILSKDDSQADRLQTRLLEEDRHDLLERVFETRVANVKKPRLLARVFYEYAELLEKTLERPEDALDARLRAVESDPGSPIYHDSALKLASKCGHMNRYIQNLEALFKNARRDSDAHIRCELLLRLGHVVESEEDFDKAREYYKQAEATGVREVDVWRACARLAGARGDKEEQMRLLTNLSSLGEEQVETETRADVLYRLAEIQLASEDTRSEGVESLRRALTEASRVTRAARILRRACEFLEPDDELLTIYEQVARESEDDELLLDYFEKRAFHVEGTPEQIREGVELADKLDELDRAEVLMLRAVDIGQELLDGPPRVAWALLGLATRRKEVGDLAGSIKWLIEASDAADPAKVYETAQALAEVAAGPQGDLTLAVKLYEQLFERDPSARDAWEPLAELYANMGDMDRLERLIEEVLGSLTDPKERNALRLRHSKLLVATPGREDEAVEALKDILLEDPNHDDAVALLADHFENTENLTELAELLSQQFSNAVGNKDVDAIRAAAIRLGRNLNKGDADPNEAIDIFRTALEFAPDDRDLLQGLLDNLDSKSNAAERAEIMERILVTKEDDSSAITLALDAASIYESLEDEEGALRVLDVAYRLAPSDNMIRKRLMEIYHKHGDDAGLASMLQQAAAEQSDVAARISILKEAATIYKDRLSDFDNAIDILRQIVELNPDDASHRIELAEILAAAGSNADAIEQLTETLEYLTDSEARFNLFKKRAGMRATTGDEQGALADLEDAFSIDSSAIAEDLEATLERLRATASETQDHEIERAHTMRLAEVMLAQEKNDLACGVIGEWLERNSDDAVAMQMLLDILSTDERWEDVARICSELVNIEEGEAQINAATRLAQASRNAGNPEMARSHLEVVLATQPEARIVRGELIQIYEKTNAHSELAAFLMEDASIMENVEKRALLLRRAGMLYLAAENFDEAAPALEASLALAPNDAETTASLVDIQLAVGALEEATRLLDTAINACKGQRSPALGLLQQRKARIARAQEDSAEELKWLKQAVLTDRANGDVALELADRASELEDWDIAVWALKTIALMKTGAPISRAQVFLRQGEISLLRGDKRRAILFGRQAQQEDPNLEEATTFLSEIETD